MKISKLIRDFLFQDHKVDLKENEFYVTDVVTCGFKKDIYKSDLNDSPVIHGDIVHLGIQSIFARIGCQSEVSVEYNVPNTPYKLKGRVDIFCPDGTLVEIKTSSVINPEHLAQLYIYMRALNVDEAYLIYVSSKVFVTYKFNGKLLCDEDTEECIDVEKQFGIRFDDELIVRLVETYKNGIKVPLLNQCKYCFFKDVCPNRLI